MDERRSPGDELTDLTSFALDHAVNSVSSGGPLIPFVVVENVQGRRLARFAAATLEEGVAQARNHLATADHGDARRLAVAYDGYLSIDGGRWDAVYIEAQDTGTAQAFVFPQRYKPKARLRKFRSVGDAVSLGAVDPLV